MPPGKSDKADRVQMGGIIQWFSCELHAWPARSHKVPSLSVALLKPSTGVSSLPVTSFLPCPRWLTDCITLHHCSFYANILPLLRWYVSTNCPLEDSDCRFILSLWAYCWKATALSPKWHLLTSAAASFMVTVRRAVGMFTCTLIFHHSPIYIPNMTPNDRGLGFSELCLFFRI